MQKLYGNHYDIYPLYCKPEDSGHSGAARNRVYFVLVHKTNAVMTCDVQYLYDCVTAVIKKHVRTEVSDYLVSSNWEVSLEAAELARSRRLRWPTTAKGVTLLHMSCARKHW